MCTYLISSLRFELAECMKLLSFGKSFESNRINCYAQNDPTLASSGTTLLHTFFQSTRLCAPYSFFDFDLTFFSLPPPKAKREKKTPSQNPTITPITSRAAAAFFLKLIMCSKSVNKYCRCSLSFANLLNFFRRSFTDFSYIEGTGGMVSCKADL
mmetsp:Transcript_64/g.88  ORF Transcript_64/g.88 Transcript_64/m.88 type:complete len:155 (-) Transcript_64:419-883(-)